MELKIQPHNFWAMQLVSAGRWHLTGLKILDLILEPEKEQTLQTDGEGRKRTEERDKERLFVGLDFKMMAVRGEEGRRE